MIGDNYMEKEVLLKLVSAAPGTIAVIIVVFAFLKFGNKTTKAHSDAAIISAQVLRQMHEEHLDARDEAREIIKENSAVQKENTKAMNDLTVALMSLVNQRKL